MTNLSQINKSYEFRLLAAIYLERYVINGRIMKPMLRVTESGEIYFMHLLGKKTLRETLDKEDRELFFKTTKEIYDYHYDLR